jgi:hypothetical protein
MRYEDEYEEDVYEEIENLLEWADHIREVTKMV